MQSIHGYIALRTHPRTVCNIVLIYLRVIKFICMRFAWSIGMFHDAPDTSAAESTYECLGCGELVTSATNPVSCPECGATMQNRAMSLE